MSDIVEDLQRCRRSGELAPLYVLDGAIDAIKSLRAEVDRLRRYLGMAADKIADYDLRGATKDSPHPIHHQPI